MKSQFLDKKSQLEKIAQQICNNTASPLHGASLCVPGEGNPEAVIVFAGEAPGFHEARQGRPFVGQAGKLLENMLTLIGLKREQVFIGNVLHFRPPNNRDPLPTEVAAEKPFLLEQIEVINPKIVATLGRFAMNIFLPEAKISQDHGHIFRVGSRIVFPLYHPAAALRSRAILEELKKDFERLGKLYQLETGRTQQEATIESRPVAALKSDRQIPLL